MRLRIVPVFAILALFMAQPLLLAATTYRYAAICDGRVCLVASGGRTRLVLAEWSNDGCWQGVAVSPKSGTIVSSLCPDAGYYAAKLYRVGPRTKARRLIPGGTGFHLPECPVWLNDNVLLLEKINKEGMGAGIWALNIRTGSSKLVVPPLPDNEFFYDSLMPSPSGRRLLTTLGITAGSWLSVNDVTRGKSLWRTNPDEGMVGFGGVAWSADDRWLYVAFYRDDEMASSSPGGVWRFDSRNGKQYLWKYAKQSIDGVWSLPRLGNLIVQRGSHIECIRQSDGAKLFELPITKIGGVVGCFGTGNHLLVCGSESVLETTLSGKTVRARRVGRLSADVVRYSSTRDAIMYGATRSDGQGDNQTGVLDLRTGRVTKFGADDWWVEWLGHDIVR